MAKEVFLRTKPNVNVGTIGHGARVRVPKDEE
jgi:translation elongation factor EF-Tu-like GTPase